jgi:hypothetical protein
VPEQVLAQGDVLFAFALQQRPLFRQRVCK